MHLRRLALPLLLTACGPDKTDSTGTDATESTAATADPATDATTPTGSSGEPTTGEPDSQDFAEMEACKLAPICDTYLHPQAEGSLYHGDIDAPDILPVETCILTGLRDGTPGRYIYGIDSQFTNGDDQRTYLIHVHADRTLTFAVHRKGSTFDGEETSSYDGHDPAQTCTLAEPQFFTDCLEATTDHDACFANLKWWIDCAEQGPRCA